MNESGLAGYPGSESVSVPPATVASVRRTWIRFGNSVSRFSLSACWLLRKTRRHTHIYIYMYLYRIYVYMYTDTFIVKPTSFFQSAIVTCKRFCSG